MARLKRFHVLASVVLRPPEPIVGQDGETDGAATGYYQNIGLTAESESSARTLVAQSILDGSVVWSECETRELSYFGARALTRPLRPSDLRAFRAKTTGIWYKSGRVLY